MSGTAWGITGAGHLLKESAELISTVGDVDVFISEAGREVLSLYRISLPVEPVSDRSASAMACRDFYAGKYRRLIIAPASANSVAKFVHGISDSLITTLFAQAGKAEVPIYVLPTDVAETVETWGVTKPLKIKPRPIDLRKTGKISACYRRRFYRGTAGSATSYLTYPR
jgi:flavoprotein